jgi:hypothetical protein
VLQRQLVRRIGLGPGDLVFGELVVGHRVETLHALGDLAIGDPLHLELVQAAEIGDLLEGKRRVVDEPNGGGLRHDRERHMSCPSCRLTGKRTGSARPGIGAPSALWGGMAAI